MDFVKLKSLIFVVTDLWTGELIVDNKSNDFKIDRLVKK